MNIGRIAVIEALIDAVTTTDQAAALPMGVSPDEVAFARAAVDTAQREAQNEEQSIERQRYLVATVLLQVYRLGDNWDTLLGRLTPCQVAQLQNLLPHMPPQPARLFTKRYSSTP